jgi:asparagine synthase (glutamine-hydrolysing)
MCGIGACAPFNQEFLERTLVANIDRGPDSSGLVQLDFGGLAVNRLAISGVQTGDQPLWNQDRTIALVFNGAIYNSKELHDRYQVPSRTGNDGEIILELYKKFGTSFADHLEGIFAVVIADLERESLIVANDQFGVKPLYWVRSNDGVFFASMISSFSLEQLPLVERFPSGLVWTSQGEWQQIKSVVAPATLEDFPEIVKSQIPSEVEWGCFLSGGVDSSLITALALQSNQRVKTFTCGTPDGSDLLAAREVAEILGTDHSERIIAIEELPDIVSKVIKATSSFERFTVMGGVGTFMVSELAHSEGVRVVLSGEGADELFGGYDEFQEVPYPFLNDWLEAAVLDLGSTECLRLDRCSMAHSLEARVPFLSQRLVPTILNTDPARKIDRRGPMPVRKAMLRSYAERFLPAKIAHREKVEFTVGAGVTGALSALAEKRVSEKAVRKLQGEFPTFPIHDALTAWFFKEWWDGVGEQLGGDWLQLVERGLFRQPTNAFNRAKWR